MINMHQVHMPMPVIVGADPTPTPPPASPNNAIALQVLGWAFIVLTVFLILDTSIPFFPVDTWFLVQGIVGIYAGKKLTKWLLGLAIFFPAWPALYWATIIVFDPNWDFASVLGEVIFVFFFLNMSMTLVAIRLFITVSKMTQEQKKAYLDRLDELNG
jgi:hypothetical protein